MPEPVPTARDLVKMGPEYAVATGWTKGTKSKPAEPTTVRIMAKGHALLGDIMRRNAAEAVAAGVGDWYPDPPHSRPREHHA